MEEEDNNDVIRYEKYLTVMTDVMLNRRYRPANENSIYRALQLLDTENKGYITKDELINAVKSEGNKYNFF
jgi:Ca2+-binding EF-hand superfamily protein